MGDLLQHYRATGLDLTTVELPDYLPLFLECLSLQPIGEIQELLGETAGTISLLRARLDKRRSPYAAVLVAIETMVPGKADSHIVRATVAGEAPAPPHEALAIPREEAPVTFKHRTSRGQGKSREGRVEPG